MPDDVPGIHEVIDDRIACLQELAAAGDTHAGTAALKLEAFRAEMLLLRDERIGWAMLAIESLVAARIS
jgi:hypothetical protein